jgi:DNA ligase-1
MNDMKVRKGYHEEGQQEILIGPRPMLAHNFKDHGKKMPFPCYGQPKYDGFRMLQDKFNVWSRGNKGYIEDCIRHLRLFNLLDELTTDGEIMLPLDSGQFNLSQSRINKFYGPEESPSSSELHYYIYDLIIPGTFRERWAVLNDWFFELQDYGDWPENVELVPTWLIQNETELQERFDWCLDNGFEGIMLRNPNGLYETGDRSYELLKLKPYGTAEAEFEIVDITEGRGSNEGCVKFICKIAKGDANFKSGKTFKCNPKWPLPKRKKLFEEFKQGKWKPIGQMLTVVYDDRTKTEVPRFPVAKNIRDYDLQGGNEGK